MGADVKNLRSRIKSVHSTHHLTRAMGLVASSKIRRATSNMQKSREYVAAMQEMMDQLCACPSCRQSVYLNGKAAGSRTRMIVIAGDRGLAGGYNANVFRLAETQNAERIPIGKRACERYGGGFPSAEKFSCQDAAALARSLCAEYIAGAFDRLLLLRTDYGSMMSQEPKIVQLLPIVPGGQKKEQSILFEPDDRQVFEAAVPKYLAGMIFAGVRESFASEIAARRMAMDSADKNASEMLDRLQIAYNRARQSAITQEITEIVAGSGR